MNLFETALFWYQQGLVCVPCYRGTKAFLKGCSPKYSKPDLAQLVEWFWRKNLNIALVTGTNNAGLNLIILDFDNVAEFVRWRLEHSFPTRIDQTKRGFHVYLWTKDEGWFEGPAEIKRDGKAIVIPPSKVGKWEYRVFEDGEIGVMDLDKVGFAAAPQLGQSRKKNSPSFPLDTERVFFSTLPLSPEGRTQLFQSIKSQISLLDYLCEYSPIKQNDRWYMAFCPAHEDTKHRSLSIDSVNGLCSCFKPNCPLHNERGFDVIGVHAVVNKMSNFEAALDLVRQNESL